MSSDSDSSDISAWTALAVAAVALLVAGAQVAQQYVTSGALLRLCDSSVYGPMPGRGQRVWQWYQFRYKVLYDMPQISINPDLWRFVNDASIQNPFEDDDLQNMPNLLLVETPLEEAAAILSKAPRWTWPLKVVKHWGWWALLTWRLPVKPHPQADYQTPSISLSTIIATGGSPDRLPELLPSEEYKTRAQADIDSSPKLLWPYKIARYYGWRTLLGWRFQISLSRQGYTAEVKCEFDSRLKHAKAVQDYDELYKDVRPGEASWVHFCRTMQVSCGHMIKYKLVRGDADRCPQDLPVAPMLVSMRDVVLLCLMAGMSFTRIDIRHRLVSMEGTRGALLCSTHPILGSILRSIPRNQAGQVWELVDMTEVRLPKHQTWLKRAVGHAGPSDTIREDGSKDKHVEQQIDRKDYLTVNHTSLDGDSRSCPASFGACPELSWFSDGDNNMQMASCTICGSPTGCLRPQNPPWLHVSAYEQAIHSWKEAWPHVDLSWETKSAKDRNLLRQHLLKGRLASGRTGRSRIWSWASELSTIRGFWATPWASHFDASFCAKAQIVIVQAMRLKLSPVGLHFVNPQGSPDHKPPWFPYPAITSTPHGSRDVSSQFIKKQDIAQGTVTKDKQHVSGFDARIPPIMLIDVLMSAGIGLSAHPDPGLDALRNQMGIDELMWLDSWLVEAASSRDLRGDWTSKIQTDIDAIMDLFYYDFENQPPAELKAGTSRRYEISRHAMSYANGSARDLLSYLDNEAKLNAAQQIYLLVVLLRTLKTAHCIATGIDTSEAREMFEKEMSVYFA